MIKSVVGKLVGRRGIVYAPVNRAGVLFLFSRLLDEFDMMVEEVSENCDYVITRRRVNSGDRALDQWERVIVSIAYRSSDLRDNDGAENGLLICWYHDWQECPYHTFELKSLFEDEMVSKGHEPSTADPEETAENKSDIWNSINANSGEILAKRGITRQRFEKAINDLDEKIKKNFPGSDS